ncbi:CbrC family protein [Trueperella sp. zg.1013]|nr:CbrC family protein [Trueperella sp. zg.1013]MBW9213181.1 CbrC family protein [Trueperella sp. zg.1013]
MIYLMGLCICENKTVIGRIYYSSFPYCVGEIEYLCPECIASGEAAKEFDAEFVQDAEWEGEVEGVI